MDQEQAFLQAMLEKPRDLALRVIFADWLDERSDPRGELLRLSHLLTQDTDQPNRPQMEDRLRSLLEAGVQPVGPFWTNSVGMKFAWIPPGVFLMGSPDTEPERGDNETQHRVRLTKGVWLGLHPVTQAQWQAVLGKKPSRFKGKDLPVERVSWDDCQEFCASLTQLGGRQYALPTEAEWEYACRAGTTTPFHFGEILNSTQANCNGNDPYGTEEKGPYLERTTVVGSYGPNAWGLHDMHGNVFEWCQDWYAEDVSVAEEAENHVQGKGNEDGCRVIRGGTWRDGAKRCRAAYRLRVVPAGRITILGCRACFRLD
jgi:uncharacterized protein (TIGR02996 family)